MITVFMLPVGCEVLGFEGRESKYKWVELSAISVRIAGKTVDGFWIV
jgi:hypothetical protein